MTPALRKQFKSDGRRVFHRKYLFLVLLWVRVIMMILFAGGALNKALEEDGFDGSELLRRKG